ncbi:formyltransferase family protein [Cyclobacteriaceae bacterium]|nr:formyltransferase family protein [Cyclobacteriaceae bacterium]
MITTNNIAILSANKYSAYSSSVLHLALTNNIKVVYIVVKKISGISHFVNEVKKNKFGLIEKIFKKVILQRLISIGIKTNLIDGFSEYFAENCNKQSTLLQLTKKYNIPIIETDNFHNENTLNLLKDCQLDLIVFTGGGLIRKSLITIPRLGIINCHMGILPFYRGMDCTYWALLENNYDKIGFTTHLMDEGVDTGAIINKYFVNYNVSKSPKSIIKFIEYKMAPAIVESMILLFSGKVKFENQKNNEGKQYFTICNELKKDKYYDI